MTDLPDRPLGRLAAQFRTALGEPGQDVALARAALVVAEGEQPGLDTDLFEAELRDWGRRLEARVHPAAEPLAQVEMANELLFGELGFRGNEQDYADPRNLLLDQVIERRTGIPITLAIVYVEVCRAAGLDMRGVGMPGHVIVRNAARPDEETLFVDVFREGALLTVADCERIVRSIYGSATPFRDHFLDPVTPRQMLQRLLYNLKANALRRGDEEQAERAIELLLVLAPWDVDEMRDRGRLRERLGRYAEALTDLETYLEYRPGARDAATIADTVRSLRRHAGAEAS
ncbi:MAG: transglutaminase-like domain-containing protein [Chloroflexota bacterium]|nr:transglutaminase-like domain-containing protein [Chloroflexota bacterium]MXZ63373.1 tetratricopeptide repeat protein [Chloroflexota bacterium]